MTGAADRDAPIDANALDGLLQELRQLEGFRIGVREEIAVTRLMAELAAHGALREREELKAVLGPLIARTEIERAKFSAAFDRWFPPEPGAAPPIAPEPPPAPPPPSKPKRRSGVSIPVVLGVVAALVVVVLVASRFIVVPGPAPQAPIETAQRQPPPSALEDAEENADETSARLSAYNLEVALRQAAEPYAMAPTVREVLRSWPQTEGVPQPTEVASERTSYSISDEVAARVAEIAGFDPDKPQPLATERWRAVRIAYAIAIAADPQTAPAPAAFGTWPMPLLDPAAAAVYEIAANWPGPVQGESAVESARRFVGEMEGVQPDDVDGVVQRGIALWNLGHEPDAVYDDPDRIDDTPPWLTPTPATARAPWWTPWAATACVLLLLALWLSNTLERRKAYLRRRAPDYPPALHDLVANAAKAAPALERVLQRAATALQQWTAWETDRLDVARTVYATVQAGKFTPAYSHARAQPDYLVLIECRGAGDQEAARQRALIERLEQRHINVVVYYFEREPYWLFPEQRSPTGLAAPFAATPVDIEALSHRFPDHRLIVLGAGEGFLDPLDETPTRGALALMFWKARAMLTPTPLAAWGPREFGIARVLNIPIGRATSVGLEHVGRLLGLNDSELRDPFAFQGDYAARVMPASLRERMTRWTIDTPVSDVAWNEMHQQLRRHLDTDTYTWLCACAVYPELRWDLTLFLGLAVTALDGQPIYREDRLAALTALPWFREGRMPDWLRARLIMQMKGQGETVRAALRELVEKSRVRGDARAEDAVRLRLATADPGAEEPFDDVIFLEFLSRGEVTDLEVSWLEPLRKLLPPAVRGMLDKIGLSLLAVALVYAAAALVLAPNGGRLGLFDSVNRLDGPLPPFAWAILAALLGAAFAALSIVDITQVRRTLADALLVGATVAGASLLVVSFLARVPPLGLDTLVGALLLLLAPIVPLVLLIPSAWLVERLSGGRGAFNTATGWMRILLAALVFLLLGWPSPLFDPQVLGVVVGAFILLPLAARWLKRPPRYRAPKRGAGLPRPGLLTTVGASLLIAVWGVWWWTWDSSRPFPDLPDNELVSARAFAQQTMLAGTSRGTVLLADPSARRVLGRIEADEEDPVIAVGLSQDGACAAWGHQSMRLGVAAFRGDVLRQVYNATASSAMAPLIAANGSGVLFARVTDAGRGAIHGVSCDGEESQAIQTAQPQSVLAAAGPGLWLLGGRDGRTRLAHFDGAQLTLDQPVAGARLGRPIVRFESAGGGVFRAIADDDTPAAPHRAILRLSDGGLELIERVAPNAEGSDAEQPDRLSEADAWTRASSLNTEPGYADYLRDHPNGANAEEARERLAELQAVRADEEAWAQAQTTNTRASLQDYLNRFPNGVHVGEARDAIGRLAQQLPSAPVPAPAVTCPTSDAVVYFEWDRSNLNQAALETIDAMVVRARQCNIAQVLVVGHTDTSLSAEEAMGISERRASVVRDALVARGIPAGLITTQARGETDLARQTADGVREPLNRRTAITITFR